MMRKQVDHVNRQGLVGADELLEALHAVMHRLRARQHQALREGEQDLTPLEVRVLGFFARHPGASQREQAGAGLDALTRDELERLLTLNAAYREKFGFPFVYAVKGSTKHDILKALERRLPSTRD